jgi:triacylglycerol lipase
MSFDRTAVARRLRALGSGMGPEVIDGSRAVYEPFHEREPYRDVRVTRDANYGPNERQRLDVFAPAGETGEPRPVFVFVHGGGFVRGDKKLPGSPYQDNVALWAVRHGMVGVNITYRLAPAFRWPSGAEDVGAAVAWVRAHIAEHGGDPARIVVAGTSAGAVHVASYVAHPELQPAGGAGIAGAVLLSGVYDLTLRPAPAPAPPADGPPMGGYFGDDPSRIAERSSIRGLVESPVPLLYVLTELDPVWFERQALHLVGEHVARHGRWPRFVRLTGHNHFTATMHLNSPDDRLGGELLDFIEAASSADR